MKKHIYTSGLNESGDSVSDYTRKTYFKRLIRCKSISERTKNEIMRKVQVQPSYLARGWLTRDSRLLYLFPDNSHYPHAE